MVILKENNHECSSSDNKDSSLIVAEVAHNVITMVLRLNARTYIITNTV